jgi:hypothetical protein
MKKTFALTAVCLILCCTINNARAQYYFYNSDYYDNAAIVELGGGVGIMNCLTDLGGNKGIGKRFIKDLNLGNTQFSGNLYASILYKNAIGLRIEGTFGQVKAYDSILKKSKASTFGRYDRNLSFRSNISEIMALVEIHPLFIFKKWDENEEAPRYSPYIVAGVGYYSFNPQAKLLNKWVDLQPLSTEGQGFAEYANRKPYKLKQLNIPIGTGVKYELSPMLNLRAELVYRILTTDYLDDVSTNYIDANLYSNYFNGTKLTNALLLNDRQYEIDPGHITSDGDQRGNAKRNDAYFTFNVKIGLILGRRKVRN